MFKLTILQSGKKLINKENPKTEYPTCTIFHEGDHLKKIGEIRPLYNEKVLTILNLFNKNNEPIGLQFQSRGKREKYLEFRKGEFRIYDTAQEILVSEILRGNSIINVAEYLYDNKNKIITKLINTMYFEDTENYSKKEVGSLILLTYFLINDLDRYTYRDEEYENGELKPNEENKRYEFKLSEYDNYKNYFYRKDPKTKKGPMVFFDFHIADFFEQKSFIEIFKTIKEGKVELDFLYNKIVHFDKDSYCINMLYKKIQEYKYFYFSKEGEKYFLNSFKKAKMYNFNFLEKIGLESFAKYLSTKKIMPMYQNFKHRILNIELAILHLKRQENKIN